MQTLVVSVVGKDLDDALAFNRLKADIKKLAARFRLALIHDAEFQFQKFTKKIIAEPILTDAELERYADALIQLGKIFTTKLADDLVPALQMNAHHLGLFQVEREPDSQNGRVVAVKKEVLEKQFAHNAIPIIAPILKTREGKLAYLSAESVAARLASELDADMLFFLDESFKLKKESLEKIAIKSLREGTKRAFVTNLSGLEAVALRGEPDQTEVLPSLT